MKPSRILVLGGTQFVGRHIVSALLERGHAVTVLNRGWSADPLPDAVERIRGDRDAGPAGLVGLGDRTWDACIDISGYTVPQVRASVEALALRVGRCIFISTIAVHADMSRGPIREHDPRLPPAADDVTEVDGATYGPLKVACEDVVTEAYGDRAMILRPQIITGPHDPFDRVTWWVGRAGEARAEGVPMIAPGDGTDHVQFVDVRDLAAFAVRLIEDDRGGTFSVAGPRTTWRAFLDALGGPPVTWAPAAGLTAALASPFELPLYQPAGGAWSGLFDVDAAAATAAGFIARPQEETIADVRAWLAAPEAGPARSLSREREAELLAAAGAN
jgi:2'-hydroxyisoflavone reductase